MAYAFTANEQGYFEQPLFNVIYSYMEMASQGVSIDITFSTETEDVLIHKKMSEIDTNMERNGTNDPFILRMKIKNVMVTFESTPIGVIVNVYRYSNNALASPKIFKPTIVVINN